MVLSKDSCFENESGGANFDDFSYSAANYHKLKLQLLESKMTALRSRVNSMPIKRPPKVFGHAIHDSGRSSYLNVVVREHLDGHPGCQIHFIQQKKLMIAMKNFSMLRKHQTVVTLKNVLTAEKKRLSKVDGPK